MSRNSNRDCSNRNKRVHNNRVFRNLCSKALRGVGGHGKALSNGTGDCNGVYGGMGGVPADSCGAALPIDTRDRLFCRLSVHGRTRQVLPTPPRPEPV